MVYTDYTVRLESGDTWTMRMCVGEASAPIRHVDEEGTAYSTPYQTADARHSPMRAAELLQSGWDRDDAVIDVREG